ncbi:MAG TPA: hypothetical protein VE326_11545 [Candidatus Binatia bacterium]|nr:hypothetical protein [Candidatus Binatia bacterium]
MTDEDKTAADSEPATNELPADADAPGNAEVQKAFDTATEQGYFGTKVDETDDAEYTVEGVTKNASK